MISGFSRHVYEAFILPGCYAVLTGS